MFFFLRYVSSHFFFASIFSILFSMLLSRYYQIFLLLIHFFFSSFIEASSLHIFLICILRWYISDFSLYRVALLSFFIFLLHILPLLVFWFSFAFAYMSLLASSLSCRHFHILSDIFRFVSFLIYDDFMFSLRFIYFIMASFSFPFSSFFVDIIFPSIFYAFAFPCLLFLSLMILLFSRAFRVPFHIFMIFFFFFMLISFSFSQYSLQSFFSSRFSFFPPRHAYISRDALLSSSFFAIIASFSSFGFSSSLILRFFHASASSCQRWLIALSLLYYFRCHAFASLSFTADALFFFCDSLLPSSLMMLMIFFDDIFRRAIWFFIFLLYCCIRCWYFDDIHLSLIFHFLLLRVL